MYVPRPRTAWHLHSWHRRRTAATAKPTAATAAAAVAPAETPPVKSATGERTADLHAGRIDPKTHEGGKLLDGDEPRAVRIESRPEPP